MQIILFGLNDLISTKLNERLILFMETVDNKEVLLWHPPARIQYDNIVLDIFTKIYICKSNMYNYSVKNIGVGRKIKLFEDIRIY